MPSSLGKDNNGLPNGNSQNDKLTQKTSASVQIPTKNGRKKAAKDDGGGGILAAVAKNASKNAAKAPTPPSSVQSPEIRPTISPENGNTHPRASPLLSPPTASPASQATSDWTRTVPSFSSSPNNLISLGESPPVLPSSYDERASNGGWGTREQRLFHHGHPQSVSPPTRSRRPLSYQGSDDLGMSPYGIRRSSLYAQYPQNLRYGNQPPLPHQPQAHFYGVPDANLLLSPRMPGLTPGENGLYCGFDSIPTAFQSSSKSSDNALVAGYEGGVTIYSIARGGLHRITDIRGLRGGVYHAKVLPWTVRDSQENVCPLIALVVHGRVSPSSEEVPDETTTTPPGATSPTRTEPTRGLPQVPGLLPHENEEFQTSVEIYSLSTSEHIATLLSVSKVDISSGPSYPSSSTPEGALSIRADSGTVIVTSGVTGETWIFRHENFKEASGGTFRCIGKIWTTIQHGLSVDSTSTAGNIDGDWHTAEHSSKQMLYKSSILSLSGRWLAYCPAAASSQISLRASVPVATLTSKSPGINSHAPPQLPAINCAVETPGGESIVKQLAQLATQEFIKGATYVGKQGVQAWNNWWNPPTTSQQTGGGGYQTHGTMVQQFPPTHGNPSQAPAIKDPGLVSILDLDFLAHQGSTSTSIHPLATFKIPHGCSFLSFAPGGLMLFTASNKGDVQFVWDLKRMHYAKSSLLKAGLQSNALQGPHVRQVAQFSRMTIARIVDVVWTSPHGERAAMVTEPGTVHILDIPASAFTWPPPRRKLPAPKPEDSAGETASPGLSAVSVASNAVTSIWTAARPLVSRPRRSSAGISGISASSVTSQAGHGTHALAAGISRSVGAATGKVNEMRKASGNKVHVPRSLTFPAPGCVKLFGGKRSDSIHVVGDGAIRIYTVKSRQADRPTDKQKASRSAKYVEYRIPQLPDLKMASEVAFAGGLEVDFDGEEEMRRSARWAGRVAPQHVPIRKPGVESSIPQAEIESNAPYQPFHTDRRVGLYVYSTHDDPMPSPSVSALLSPVGQANTIGPGYVNNSGPWAFGRPIKSIRLNVGPPQGNDDDYDIGPDHRALPSSAIERIMKMTDNDEEIEQIVITTRKRRGVARNGGEGAGDADEGFFEDDCEVLDFASQRV
ncbi:hypothetical protein F5884DRAFT_188834 [Xylogone sp. PMI_703]|nr:hypothetical protein F5884DRAFT_188834 [Xylogone sp. PMI_703]